MLHNTIYYIHNTPMFKHSNTQTHYYPTTTITIQLFSYTTILYTIHYTASLLYYKHYTAHHH